MTETDSGKNEIVMLAAFEQNHASFRSLNTQMWQIPLISMTLTGGLWFAVSGTSDFPMFQVALLALAGAGNIALAIIIVRLRFVMNQHLTWLEDNFSQGFVSATGKRWYDKPFVVRTAFQTILVLAALVSFILLGFTVWQTDWRKALTSMNDKPIIAFYDSYAIDLADHYESVDPTIAHVALGEFLRSLPTDTHLDILDIGAGSGRDAAWFSNLGHSVTAVEPSQAMRRIAQSIHPSDSITWLSDSLPQMESLRDSAAKFDLILLSAVWMHIPDEDRPKAIRNVLELLTENGRIFLTLRLGPSDIERGIHSVSEEEIRRMVEPLGYIVQDFGRMPDLLGRQDVQWTTISISGP